MITRNCEGTLCQCCTNGLRCCARTTTGLGACFARAICMRILEFALIIGGIAYVVYLFASAPARAAWEARQWAVQQWPGT